jgi:hypothetical protein
MQRPALVCACWGVLPSSKRPQRGLLDGGEDGCNGLRRARGARGGRRIDQAWLVKQNTGVTVSEAALSRLERQVDTSPLTRAALARALGVAPEELWEEAA